MIVFNLGNNALGAVVVIAVAAVSIVKIIVAGREPRERTHDAMRSPATNGQVQASKVQRPPRPAAPPAAPPSSQGVRR